MNIPPTLTQLTQQLLGSGKGWTQHPTYTISCGDKSFALAAADLAPPLPDPALDKVEYLFWSLKQNQRINLLFLQHA